MTQNLNSYMQQILMKTQEKMKPEKTRYIHEMITKLSSLTRAPAYSLPQVN